MGAVGSSPVTSEVGGKFSAKDVNSVLLKAGALVALKPGEALITQGEPEPSLFFVLHGEVAITRTNPQGKTKEIGRRGRHEVVGEMSFLLNTPPTASVGVPPDFPRDVTVVEVKRARVTALLQRDPKFASKVFKLLTMSLAHRIALASSAKSDLHTSTHLPAEHNSRNSALESAVGEVLPASRFGLGTVAQFVFQTPCTVLIEEEGTWGARYNALLAVFSSHLCLELSAMNFVSTRNTPFEDVLHCEQVDNPTYPSPVLHVSCRGSSLLIGLDAAVVEYVRGVIEQRRVHTVAAAAMATEEGDVRELSGVKVGLREGSLARIYDELYMRQWVSMAEPELLEHHHRASHVPLIDHERSEEEAQLVAEEQLSLDEWSILIKGAEHILLKEGKAIIKEGESTRALYQLTSGTATVEVHIKGRPQAVVVARKNAGDIFGERSLLFGGHAKASVVVSSTTASVIRLKGSYLKKLFNSAHPQLPAKFFYFLALDQARRLQALTQADQIVETVVAERGGAPTKIDDFVGNPAYLSILLRYVHAEEKRANRRHTAAKDATSTRTSANSKPSTASSSANGKPSTASSSADGKPSKASSSADENEKVTLMANSRRALEFMIDYQQFESTSSNSILKVGQRLYSLYLSGGKISSRQLRFVSKRLRSGCEINLKALQKEQLRHEGAMLEGSEGALIGSRVREAFAEVAHVCKKYIELNCVGEFLLSAEYEYILALRAKEQTMTTPGDFKPVRLLSEDGGDVKTIEVMKRDCGKRYAMRTYTVAGLRTRYGGEGKWKSELCRERALQTELRHQLVVNVAYAFHTSLELFLILDPVCDVSLRNYIQADEPLSAAQVLFVASKIVAILAHLHKNGCLFRNLRPEALLVDGSGQIRLDGFDLAVQSGLTGTKSLPECNEAVGTPAYQAPEVLAIKQAKQLWIDSKEVAAKVLTPLGLGAQNARATYSAPADFWAFGVILHEIGGGGTLPFGESPTLETMFDDHTSLTQKLRRARSHQMLEMSLLAWDPMARAGSKGIEEIMELAYFRDIDWSADDGTKEGRVASPLRDFKLWKDVQRKKADATRKRREKVDSQMIDETLTDAPAAAMAAPTANPERGSVAGANPERGSVVGASPERGSVAGASSKKLKDEMTAKEEEELGNWDYISSVSLISEFINTVSSQTSLL